jgi:prepilin-type N-terminal cleavage/methylation domain-containing protein
MKNKAFSLIELAVVILIIGTLVAGVVQGSRMIDAARVQTAQTVTQSSPVAGIPNLVIWLDASASNSFDSAEAVDGTQITNWYDVNPHVTSKAVVTQATTLDKPTYIAEAINNLPSVRFNGTNGCLTNTTLAVGVHMSSFIVAKTSSVTAVFRRLISISTGYFVGIGNGTPAPVGQFAVFYNDGGGFNHTAGFGADSVLTVDKDYVFSATLNALGINKGYINGVDVGSPPTTPESKVVSSGMYVGCHNTSGTQRWFGDIAEIIVFDRALSADERKAIEKYLGKKWGITVS